MTVLGLKLSRRANAVSSLHGEVSRAMWTEPLSRQARGRRAHRPHHQRRPCAVLARPADVSPLRPPPRHRLAEQQRRSRHGGHRKRRRRRALGDAPQPQIAAPRIHPPRALSSRPNAAPSPAKPCNGSQSCFSPDAFTIGFARRFATYKRANLVLADIERLAAMVNDPKRPVQFVFAGKAHPHDEPGKRVLQQIAADDARLRIRRKVRLHRGLRHQRRPPSRAGRRRLAQQSPPPARSLRHQRTKSGAQRRPQSLSPRRLVGRSLRRPQRLRHRQGRTHSNMDVHDSRDGEDLYRVLRDESSRSTTARHEASPRLDQAHETHHPHPRMALQRRPHGHGLHQKCYVPAAGGTSSEIKFIS